MLDITSRKKRKKNIGKKKQLNKGLDLEGGINVTLQISIKDILKGLADNSKNPVFNKALEDADDLSKNSDDTYIDLFFEAFDNIKGDTKLASPDIFANKGLSDQVNFQILSNSSFQCVCHPVFIHFIFSSSAKLRSYRVEYTNGTFCGHWNYLVVILLSHFG